MFDALNNPNKIWSLLKDHWKTYTKKYHMVGVQECIDNNNFGKVDCGNEEEGNDDDCMFFCQERKTAISRKLLNRIATMIGLGLQTKDGMKVFSLLITADNRGSKMR